MLLTRVLPGNASAENFYKNSVSSRLAATHHLAKLVWSSICTLPGGWPGPRQS